MNENDIQKEILRLNHEMNLSDDNREQDYIMNEICNLKEKLKEEMKEGD